MNRFNHRVATVFFGAPGLSISDAVPDTVGWGGIKMMYLT